MKIERTGTYIRFYLGVHYFTWITRDYSMKSMCKMIKLTPKLDTRHVIEMRDYLTSYLEYNRGIK
jgi:hypothetical protein